MPLAGGDGQLELMNSTVGEISKAAGYYPACDENASERDLEILHETAFLNHDVRVFKGSRLGEDLDEKATWSFELQHPGEDIEEYNFELKQLPDLTKMALARVLQLRNNLSDQERNRLWETLSKAHLVRDITGVFFSFEPDLTCVTASSPEPTHSFRRSKHVETCVFFFFFKFVTLIYVC